MKCAKCKEKLPKGTTYCAGCGIDSEDLYAKKMKVEGKFETRIARGKFWNKLSTIFRIFR